MRCVTVRTEYIVQVSDNKMSCKTFGSKKDKVNGQVIITRGGCELLRMLSISAAY